MVHITSLTLQNLPQTYWNALGLFKPELFLWTGDAVYTKSNSLQGLEEAYDQLKRNSHYNDFQKNTTIHGIWDDHGVYSATVMIVMLLALLAGTR